ncbi:putative sister chromatid cohesion protein Pds5 [Plasmopara halstedii]
MSLMNRQEAAKLMKLLVEILRSNGSKFAVTSAQTAMFRLTASCGLLKMMRNPQLETLLSISEWHLLGISIQDSSEEVRRQFLKKLTSHVVKHSVRHPHKYLSYLALVATETTFSLKKEARNILKIAVERMRRMFDAASENSNPDQDPNLNAVIVPEYALPYVIHLLAHHPSFPTNLVEKTSLVSILQSAEWSDQLAYLEFFLMG